MPSVFVWIVIFAAGAGAGLFLAGFLDEDAPLEPMSDTEWWRAGSKSPDDTRIHSFKIDVPEKEIESLKERLKQTRQGPVMVDTKFHNGMNMNYLYNTVLPYWRDKYDWKNQQAELNKFPHFTTQIEGLNIHFIHVKPKAVYVKKGNAKVLMMIHGWPGSVYEFYKIIPMLTDPLQFGGREDDVFEVICPSIPGYAWSEAPQVTGLSARETARIFTKLMQRLKFDRFYVQGGDWGSLVAPLMAQYFPQRVMGVHVNMVFPPNKNLDYATRLAIGSVAPSLVLDPKDHDKLYPFIEKMLLLLREMGYFAIQVTKPDTVGVGLTDSPAGLAAYILEKFSTWTNQEYIERSDGGLTERYTMDELLTNVMIYWTTSSIVSSQRFYKENLPHLEADSKNKCHAIAGYASFKNELAVFPEEWTRRYRFPNLVHYSDNDEGGHFAALEVPSLLAKDIRKFVRKVEESRLYFAGHVGGS